VAAAAAVLSRAGFEALLLDDAVNEPATELAARHATIAAEIRPTGRRVALITGGETTVRVVNRTGRGGRNTQYLLALAIALGADRGTWALAGDTDGIDGTEDNAGALLAPDSLRRAAAAGVRGETLLADHCAWDFFAGQGDLLISGPTGTNVNDLRIVLVNA
jgi:glycerate 2-kinase